MDYSMFQCLHIEKQKQWDSLTVIVLRQLGNDSRRYPHPIPMKKKASISAQHQKISICPRRYATTDLETARTGQGHQEEAVFG
jgi:hypothetical protein